MTIYLDIVCIENIVLNYLILVCTGKILKIKVRVIRTLIASFLGSIFSILNLIYPLNNIGNIIYKIVISLLMVKIIFRIESFKDYAKKILFFYLISFVFGGLTLAMLYFVDSNSLKINKYNLFSGKYVLKIVIISSVLSFVLLHIIIGYLKEKSFVKKSICYVEIVYNSMILKTKCFIDTGNLLKEPITGKDVIIVEKEILNNVLDKTILDSLLNIESGNILDNEKNMSNVFVIPYSSLGKNNSIILGFKPDCIKIICDEEKIVKNAIIGIYDGIISENGLYHGLIGINILKDIYNC